jgi:hypothetical protein
MEEEGSVAVLLAGESAEWGFLVLVVVEGGGGRRRGAHCRYGVMNAYEMTIMNHLHVWSLIRPLGTGV